MAEYIDIDAPIDVAVYQRNRRIQVTLRQILESNDAKYERADVRPVVRSHWFDGACVYCGFKPALDYEYATVYDDYNEYRWNFCPNCGADMREES